jgi:hypothetical protein
MVLTGGAGALAAIGCVDRSIGNGPGVNFCCNANPDPCCESQYCGAPVNVDCTVKMACEADCGTWDQGSGGCSRPDDSGPGDAPSDALTYPDSGPGDTLSDAVTYPDVSAFCCNANPDPCCPSQYCGATMTVQCTEKMACEANGGTWNFAGGCALDAGTRDASSDSP